MICSRCGYLMDAFDPVCPKCHGDEVKPQTAITPPQPTSPSPAQSQAAQVQPASSAVQPQSGQAGNPFGTPFGNRRSSQHPLVLSCPVCAGDNVQKVGAVYEAGTQHSTSRGTTGGHSAGLGYASGLGFVPIVGVSSSQTTTRHSSQTNLAYRLQPPSPLPHPPAPLSPQPPTLGTVGSETGTGDGLVFTLLWALWAVPGGFIYSLGYRPGLNLGGFLFLLSVGPVLGCLAFHGWEVVNAVLEGRVAQRRFSAEVAIWNTQASQLTANWKQRELAWRAECAALDARSQERMERWKQLFYCHRCDLVFHPETVESAPAAKMRTLL